MAKTAESGGFAIYLECELGLTRTGSGSGVSQTYARRVSDGARNAMGV